MGALKLSEKNNLAIRWLKSITGDTCRLIALVIVIVIVAVPCCKKVTFWTMASG